MSKLFLTTLSLMLLLTGSVFAQESSDTDTDSEELKSGPPHHDGHPRHHKKMHRHNPGEQADRAIKRIDTNDDGKVDLNEYLSHTEQRFKQADINSDGYVTSEEMRETIKAMRKKHRKAMKEARKAYKESKQAAE